MSAASLLQITTKPVASEFDDRRRASWLHSAYSEPLWIVADTRDAGRTATIDFGIRLADGRLLPQAERLYATVKEYAWWVRDPRFSRIDDAKTHSLMVRNLMNLAHALTWRNIWSFAHVQPYDLEQLIEEVRFGADAVLHASERLELHLRELARENSEHARPDGGLPRYVYSDRNKSTTYIHAERVVADCNLPSTAVRLPRVAALMAAAAEANGLTPRHFVREFGPLQNITVQAVQRWLDPLEQLYAMRRRIEAEAIDFKPFPLGVARVARVKGVGASRTPIPPPKLALHLLEQAAKWVLDHGQTEVSASTLDSRNARHLAAACWILIAAFTARRDEEIDDLREGCLRGSDDAGWWLHVYIEKTLQRKEWIPVPTLVARAVQVMSAISESARRTTGSDQLFQMTLQRKGPVRLDIGRHLDDFAKAAKVPLHHPKVGPAVEWHWHPHQFRRFFAVLYFYRFEGATIEVLSHHLRHFSLEMTKRYVTQDPEVAALWLDVEWGYMGHVARSIVSGERSISGAAGEKLKKTAKRLVDLFRRKLQVAEPDRVGASLALVMQRNGMVLTPKPWVTCSCPKTREAAAKAACRSRGESQESYATGPNFVNAGPSVCPSCPHAIAEGTRSEFIRSEVAHLSAASASHARSHTLFGALEQARLVDLNTFKERCYDSAAALSSE